MSHAWTFIAGAIAFMAALAAFSRIAKMEQSPEYIVNASKALGNLFNGAFGL